MKDPDWILASDNDKTQFGFVPSNYIQIGSSETPQQAAQPATSVPATQQQQPQIPVNQNIPSLTKERSPEQAPTASMPVRDFPRPNQPVTSGYNQVEEEEEEAPPPMPNRPVGNETPTRPSRVELYEQVEDVEQGRNHTFDGEFFTWYIDEVDGRKKRSVVLSIGQGLIIVKADKGTPKKFKIRGASNRDDQWRIRDLIDFSHEKKHVFLEFKNPSASIELHTGTKDVADAIMSILGDLKGAESAKGLKEVERASKAKTGAGNRKVGRLMYDFEAQSRDELDCKEGDEVYVIDESKSRDWWMVENTDTRRQGVVPSAYIEIISTSNLDKLTEGPVRHKSTKTKEKARHHHRSREERDRVREKDRLQREKESSKQKNEEDKSMPNYHRVRTWIDSSGSFKVEAEFLGCHEGKIHLHKTNGVKIAVGAEKLSIEDLEYVEKVTGTSLEKYKEAVMKQLEKKPKAKSGATSEMKKAPSATAVINDVTPARPTRQKTKSMLSPAGRAPESDYDWFDFFLECGVDIGNCQRYTLNFNREQMDQNILEDISPSLLRTLGLREGDIIRVMKYLDNKFDRKKTSEEAKPAGGLFVDTNGALKTNIAASEVSKVTAEALPSPVKAATPETKSTNKIEDDAWAVKPAARSSEDLLKPVQPQAPQYTGSLSDLVNIKPTIDNKPLPAPPASSSSQIPSAPPLQPVKTNNTLIQPDQKFAIQTQGAAVPVPAQRTGTLIPVQRTGGGVLVPVQTGGILAAQPTGFVPITAQPTGFMPIQQTGIIQPQLTFGIIPLQTGSTTFVPQQSGIQRADSAPPVTTFGQSFVPLQAGTVTMPPTTFAIPAQLTGGLPPTTFNQPAMVPAQRTGGQITGGFVPQSAFGKQITGGFMGTNVVPNTSFGQQPVAAGGPVTSFSQQLTGGLPATSFGAQVTSGLPPTSFGAQPAMAPAPTPQPAFGAPVGFGQQVTANPFPQQTMNQFQSQQPMNAFPQQPQQAMNPFPQQQQSYGQFPQQQQQPQQFNQFQQPFNQFSSQPNMNQMVNQFQATSISSPPSFGQQAPVTSFGQAQFEGFSNQPLQSQPTGTGFGNAPLQTQPTGQKANILAATPDNPFGFGF